MIIKFAMVAFILATSLLKAAAVLRVRQQRR